MTCLTYLRKHYCSSETASAWCLWSVVSREQFYGRSWPCGLAVSHRIAKTTCLHGPHTVPQTTWDTAAPWNQLGLWQISVLVQGHVKAFNMQISYLHRTVHKYSKALLIMLLTQFAFQLKCPTSNWKVKHVTQLVDMNLRGEQQQKALSVHAYVAHNELNAAYRWTNIMAQPKGLGWFMLAYI